MVRGIINNYACYWVSSSSELPQTLYAVPQGATTASRFVMLLNTSRVGLLCLGPMPHKDAPSFT